MSSDAASSPSSPEQLLSERPVDPPPTTVPHYSAHDFRLPSKNVGWLWGLAGLLVLVGAVWLYQHFAQGLFGASRSQNLPSALARYATPNSNTPQSPAPDTEALAHPVDTGAESSTRAEPSDKIPTVPLVELMNGPRTIPREPITPQRFPDDPKISQLQEQVAQLDLAVATLTDALETQKKTFEQQFTALTAKWQAVPKAQLAAPHLPPGSRGNTTAASSRAGERTIPSSGRPERSVPPLPKIPVPFTLVSINQWGDATEVLVRYRGNVTRLTAEHPLGQWRLAEVDALGHNITVIHAQGQRAVLTQP